ncbi:MAG: PPC domain-containing DNA-binding protein [Rhodospirillales bacterium]
MQSKLLNGGNGGARTYAVVLETDEEVMGCLKAFADSERLSAAHFSAIGAFSDAVLAYFDWQEKKYRPIPVDEQVEVATLTGDIAIAPDGSRALHVHLIVGRRDGSALAGHLERAHVRPTLEVILTESPAHLRRVHDPESGLALIRPEG